MREPRTLLAKLASWRQDMTLKRLLANAAFLLGGNGGAAVLGLVSLAVTARALRPELFGTLVLISTYVMVIDRLVNFQSWQALIKYGAVALEQRDKNEFQSLIKCGFVLDAGTGLVGAALAASMAWFVGHWWGWDPQVMTLAMAYSLTIVFHISGTPTAILRLFDRFRLFSFIVVAGSAVKLVGVTIAAFAESDLMGFLVVWAVTDILANLLLIAFALRELRVQDYRRIRAASLSDITRRYPGLIQFLWTTNLQTGLKSAVREADLFISAWLIGPAAVAGLKVIKQFSGMLTKLTDPLFHTMLPAFSLATARNEIAELKRLMVQLAAILAVVSGGLWILVLFFADMMLGLILGVEYQQYADPWRVYMLSIVILAVSLPLNPALLSLGRARAYLLSTVFASVVYLPLLMLLGSRFETMGIAAASVIYAVVWLLSAMWFVVGAFRKAGAALNAGDDSNAVRRTGRRES